MASEIRFVCPDITNLSEWVALDVTRLSKQMHEKMEVYIISLSK